MIVLLRKNQRENQKVFMKHILRRDDKTHIERDLIST